MAHISENKNNLGIDIGIVPKISGFNIQMHDNRHKLWARALAIYGSSKLAFNMKTSTRRPDVPKVSGSHVLNVTAYGQKLPNVIGDDTSEVDVHLALAPMRLTTMGVDSETKQASLILMPSFIGRLRHWA